MIWKTVAMLLVTGAALRSARAADPPALIGRRWRNRRQTASDQTDDRVEDVAGAGLVAFQDLLFEPGIGVGHLWLGGPAGGNGHAKSPLGTRRLVRFGGETVSRVFAGGK